MPTSAYALHHDPISAELAIRADEEREFDSHKRARQREERAWLAGRLVLAAVFLIAAVVKAVTFTDVSRALEARELASPSLLLSIAIAVELLGGTLLALGFHVRRAAVGLIGWVAIATLFIHGDFSDPMNRSFALSNVAFIAGLLLIAARGAGIASLDAQRLRKQLQQETP